MGGGLVVAEALEGAAEHESGVRVVRYVMDEALQLKAGAVELGGVKVASGGEAADVGVVRVRLKKRPQEGEGTERVARAAALCPLDAPRDELPAPLGELFQHIADGAPLYRRMLGTQGSALFAARMRERLTTELTSSFRDGRRPVGFDDVPVEVHAAFLAGALTGVIASWVTEDVPAPAEETALAFWRLFRR